MRSIYHGLMALYNGKHYQATISDQNVILKSDRCEFDGMYTKEIDIENITSIFYVDNKVLYKGLTANIVEIGDGNIKIRFKKGIATMYWEFEDYGRLLGNKIISLDECDEVYMLKTKFRDFEIKGDNKIFFNSYEELEDMVIFD